MHVSSDEAYAPVTMAKHFMEKFAKELGKSQLTLSQPAVESLQSHTWPGNVRELENTMERAVVLANDTDVGIEDLMLNTLDPSNHEESLSAYVDRMTKAYVAKVLQECQGVKVDACKKLSVERTTLYRLIKKYQLDSI